MDKINLDEISHVNVSNTQIYDDLKSLFDESSILDISGCLKASGLIQLVSNRKILNDCVKLLEKNGYIFNDPLCLLPYGVEFNYLENDLVKIEAVIYGVFLSYMASEKSNEELNIILFNNLDYKHDSIPQHELPELKFAIKGRLLYHNSDEVDRLIMKKSVIIAMQKVFTFPIEMQKEEISKLIATIINITYAGRNFNFFQEDITYLERVRDNIPDKLKLVDLASNQHADIFRNDGFLLWEYIMEHFINPGYGRASDVAYFYQLLSTHKKKYIHRKKDYFLEWYNDYYREEINRLKAFPPCSNLAHERQFSIAIDWLSEQSTKKNN